MSKRLVNVESTHRLRNIMPKVLLFSHIGNSGEIQEDNFIIGKNKILSVDERKKMSADRTVCVFEIEAEKDFCVAVSDGMGGYECGEDASLFVVNYFSDNYYNLIEETKKDRDYIKKFVAELNRSFCIVADKKLETKEMAATLCGLISVDGDFICFNVGDSRLYQLNCGELLQVTVDNTEGQRLLDLGLLKKENMKDFPGRKSVYKYIGKKVELVPNIYNINNVSPETLFLLCSDGLSDVLGKKEMSEVLRVSSLSLYEKGKKLVDLALERSKSFGDNITIMLISFEGDNA